MVFAMMSLNVSKPYTARSTPKKAMSAAQASDAARTYMRARMRACKVGPVAAHELAVPERGCPLANLGA
jgi:hypothetical protein